jgi:flagellar biosynthesis protein FlhF
LVNDPAIFARYHPAMRLKLYRAPSVAEAMARVRAELGLDALILATRRVSDGVELTAALEPDDAPDPPPDPQREKLLAWHGVPAALAAAMQGGSLEEALARTMRFAALDFQDDRSPPLLLAGPPGAGKTLTVARLATRLVIGGATPLIITTDGRRAGATEQLAAFTRLLGLTLIVASHPVTLARALLRRQPGAPVLIDAPGTDPFDQAQQDEISGLAATANADMAAAFAESGASLLIGTRLDMARRLGGLLSAADSGKLTLVEAGVGPGAADGLTPLTAALLADRLNRTGDARPEAAAKPATKAHPAVSPRASYAELPT